VVVLLSAADASCPAGFPAHYNIVILTYKYLLRTWLLQTGK